MWKLRHGAVVVYPRSCDHVVEGFKSRSTQSLHVSSPSSSIACGPRQDTEQLCDPGKVISPFLRSTVRERMWATSDVSAFNNLHEEKATVYFFLVVM